MEAKFYYKSDLALAYFPDTSCEISSAVRRLNRWIQNIPALCRALTASGYHAHQKHFTRAQTALIFEYLGEP